MRYFVLLLIAALLPQIPLAEGSFKQYVNARYGYSISYPADILRPQGESDNGDGQKFLSIDGDAELLVYGANNVLEQSLEELYSEASQAGGAEHPERAVTYRVIKKDWFVVSGRQGGKIFYQKTIRNDDQFVSFILEYPESRKATFDPIAGFISKSFKLVP